MTPPGDATLTLDPLEITDEHHAEVHPRRDALPAPNVVTLVILFAPRLDPSVESGLSQQQVEFLVERMPRRMSQLIRRNEQRLLPRRPLAHRHRKSLPNMANRPRQSTMPVKGLFSTGC